MNDLPDYPRPHLSDDELNKIVKSSRKLNFLQMEKRGQIVLRLMFENAYLLRECNEHRAARGFAPLPVFPIGDPS
jgi:hypothetical protein